MTATKAPKGIKPATPRTDYACHGFVQANPQKTDVDMWGIQCVDADFARELENDLERISSEHAALVLKNRLLTRDYDLLVSENIRLTAALSQILGGCGDGSARDARATAADAISRIVAKSTPVPFAATKQA